MAETISQRVNALFASYVATEDEQRRLGELGTPEALEQASDLGTPALAIRDEVFAIRDRSACPDLVAARVLLDLMLSHPWPPTSETEWGEDAEVALPMLEILADRVTGAVRVETRRALATIGVDVPEEAADPMLALINLHRQGCAIYGAQTPDLSDEDDDALAAATWVPHYRALRDETPATTTLRGAAEAVREVLAEMGDQEHTATFEAGVLRSVLAFLDGEAA